MKDDIATAELLAQMQQRAAEMDCPVCGESGSITVVERWMPTRSRPYPITRGPRGFPLWSQCGQCHSGGFVAKQRSGWPS